MIFSDCQPYHARLANMRRLHLADKLSVYKIYYLSIVDRERPEKYEWLHCEQTYQDFESLLTAKLQPGVGFITAFPHIAKIFRFSPQAETILDVKEYRTSDLSILNCTEEDGFHEFACYAEADIAAAEYRAWADAPSMAEYLEFTCPSDDFPVVNHRKLASYWRAGPFV